MGYDLHITRAFMSFDSERYPILGTEVDDLVRGEPDLTIPPDAPRRPDFCYVAWESGAPDRDDHLLFRAGRLTTKHPRPGLLRRMIELAAARRRPLDPLSAGRLLDWAPVRPADAVLPRPRPDRSAACRRANSAPDGGARCVAGGQGPRRRGPARLSTAGDHIAKLTCLTSWQVLRRSNR